MATTFSLSASAARACPNGVRLRQGTSAYLGTRLASPSLATATVQGRQQLVVHNFKFMKQLGLKKPDFLPDFGKDKRKALLDRFYTSFDRGTYDELLADNFEMVEGGEARSDADKRFNKQQYTSLVLDTLLPAIPDFKWGHATDGTKDAEGYAIVTVQATGHHTGKPFALGDLPPVAASGKRFHLEEEVCKVKVEDGQIQQIVVLPVKGAGPLALYKALGGQVPGDH